MGKTEHFLKELQRASSKDKISLLVSYYLDDRKTSKFITLYHNKDYSEALNQLVRYLQAMENNLRLRLILIEGNSINRDLNDYQSVNNHAVIRSKKQLSGVLLKLLDGNAFGATEENRYFLLADRLEDKQKLFRELFHELNAWLCSGCFGGHCPPAGDWRQYLPPGQIHRQLDRLLDDEVPDGLKKQLVKLLHYLTTSGKLKSLAPLRDGGGLYAYRADARNAASGKAVWSYGVSFASRELAMVKCLSELLERLATRWAGTATVSLKPSSVLRGEPYFADYFDGKKDIPVAWIKGVHLFTGKEVSVPAQFVYSDFAGFRGEQSIAPFTAIGSGVAAGQVHEQVVLNALYELIERDALVTGYLKKRIPRRVDPAVLGGDSKQLLKAVGADEIIILDITNDISVPSYLTFLIGNGKRHISAGGIKADMDRLQALEGSVEEACLEWLLKKTGVGRTSRTSPSAGRPVLTYERYRPLIPQVCTVKSLPPQRRSQDKKEELRALIRHFETSRRDIISVEITPEWLAKSGFQINRIFVPSLQPLFFTATDQWINKRRLRGEG